MIRVRTYGFPGEFYEANPESSTRNTETNQLHVESVSPPWLCPKGSAAMRPRVPSQAGERT